MTYSGKDEEKSDGVVAGAAVQSPPVEWTAEALVTTWQEVFTGIEAHIQDRIAMRDPASPETYLSIIRADVADVVRKSQQIVNARWADSARYRAQIERLESVLVSMRDRDDRNGSLPVWYRQQIDAALANHS